MIGPFSIVELSLAVMIQRALMGALVLGIYGFMLTLLLRLWADRGPQDDGRLTLDPFTHLSLLGLAGAIIGKIGWILPLQSDGSQCRGGIFGYFAALIATLVAMIVLAHGFAILRPWCLIWFSHSSAIYAIALLNIGIDLALAVGVAALVPLPPLMAGQVWYRVWPAARARSEQIDMGLGCCLLGALLVIPSRFPASLIASLRAWVGV